MDSQKIRILVSLTIAPGKWDEFRAVAAEMSRGCRDEPGTLAYDWYLAPDRTRCRTFEAYADSHAMLAHFKGAVVTSLVPKLLGCTSLERLEIYGNLSAEAATLVAGFGAEVFPALAP